MPKKARNYILNPILSIVERSLGEVLAGIELPPLPVRSPDEFAATTGYTQEFGDAEAYVLNTLPAVVWGRCTIGLDIMKGLQRTIAADTVLSAHVLARAALESFAFAFWVCDIRTLPHEKYGSDEINRRALLLSREFVEQKRRRKRQDWGLHHDEPYDDSVLVSHLDLIDKGIATFSEQLNKDGIPYDTKLPNKSQAAQNLLEMISPIPGGLYSKLSAVVHADHGFVWDLLSHCPDGDTPHESGGRMNLSSSIITHLVPAWHALAAMHVALGVARSMFHVECNLDDIAELSKDIIGFTLHNGEETIWQRGDVSMTHDRIHALDWYFQKKGISLPEEWSTVDTDDIAPDTVDPMPA